MDRQSIHMRLPRGLHEQLREAAEHQGISLNTLIVALLAGGIGFTLERSPDAAMTAGAMTTTGGTPDAAPES